MTRPSQKNLWFGSFRFALYAQPKDGRRPTMQLFETQDEAVKAAKFALYNSESCGVYHLVDGSFTGRSVMVSTTKKRLIKTEPL